MPRIKIPLTAGVPSRQSFKAQGVVIASTGAAPLVQFVLFGSDQQDAEDYGLCERRFGVYDASRVFTGVELTATVDCIVELIVSRSRVEVMDGANVTATIAAAQLPLPVQNDRGGDLATPLYVTGLTLSETPAATVTDNAAVAAGPVAAQVLAADATRLEIVFCNLGPDPVALGMVGITWAKRVIVLGVGDTYTEWRAAAKAWYAITDAGLAGSVTTQVRKS